MSAVLYDQSGVCKLLHILTILLLQVHIVRPFGTLDKIVNVPHPYLLVCRPVEQKVERPYL